MMIMSMLIVRVLHCLFPMLDSFVLFFFSFPFFYGGTRVSTSFYSDNKVLGDRDPGEGDYNGMIMKL